MLRVETRNFHFGGISLPLSKGDAETAKQDAIENQQPAVEWFSPGQLLRTAKKVKNSTTIASHADHREIQAGFARIYDEPGQPSFHDLQARAGNGEIFYFDFVADTGDGWPATTAVADMMLRDQLLLQDPQEPKKQVALPRPGLAIFGGDLVYPVASRQEYERRFLAPFNYAALANGLGWRTPEDKIPEDGTQEELADKDYTPVIFAIPGNHDWYDGLAAFWSLFCRARLGDKGPDGRRKHERGRWAGPWYAAQQRSYFALQLPHGWWVWGIDVQLSEWTDTPQRHYFEDVALKRMAPGSKLVICTAEPSWIHGSLDGPKHFQALSYIANRAMRHGMDLRLVLSGDLHHYSCYRGEFVPGDGTPVSKCTFVTAGGGGAFSTGTHFLPKSKIDIRKMDRKYREDYYALLHGLVKEGEFYPSRGQSRWAAWSLLLLFPSRNRSFFLAAAIVWAFTGLALRNFAGGQPDPVGLAIATVPWLSMIPLAQLGKKCFLNPGEGRDCSPWWWPARWKVVLIVSCWLLLGLIHSAAQGTAGYVLSAWAWAFAAPMVNGHWAAQAVVFGFAGGIATSLVMSLYLAICTTCLNLHHNEAFSALGSTKWKNFLRICIDPQGKMKVHVVALDKLPKKDEKPVPRLIQTIDV